MVTPMKQTVRMVDSMNWTSWTPKDRATLVFIIQGDQILLIDKKTGLGKGKINGPGGRIKPGETAEVCAVREVQEELLVTPQGLNWGGRLNFLFVDGYSLQAEVFRADGYEGSPTETAEAAPIWCKVDQIPYKRMWADDRIWMPLLLLGKRFEGCFIFEGEIMLDSRVKLLD